MSHSARSTRQWMSADSKDGRADLRRAWTSLVLILAFIIGLVWVMNSVTWDLSFWAAYLILVLGMVIVLLLAAGAILFGRRAIREGKAAGEAPVVIGFVVGGLSIVWAVLPIIGRLAGFE